MTRRLWFPFLLIGALGTLVPAGVEAAIKIRQPLLEEAAPTPPSRSTEGESFFVGAVIFTRGGQVVAEITGGARERERYIVYDAGLRRKGRAVVLQTLDQGVYLLAPERSFSVESGDQLARESETEAAARVIRANRLEGYEEFIELHPDSSYRPRIGREMFRLLMKADYPTFPGSVIEGQIRLVEQTGREVPLGQALIVLDRFVIARADERGRFRIEGIPKLQEPVTLRMRVKDPKFQMAEEVTVGLGADNFEEVPAQLAVSLTPTVLAGQVLDERGAPLPGAEVWTSPYTMEALTDDDGRYRISRKKIADEGVSAGDQPIFGGEYEVYAYRKGYEVDRATVSAESYQENEVSAIQMERQDPREESLPALGVVLESYLEIDPGTLGAPRAAGPVLNP